MSRQSDIETTDQGDAVDRCKHAESGFSLIEALVVLAISSMLLVVLTETLVASQRGHQRLEDHFERRGERFYFDLQMQALVDHVYLDPLLHPAGWQPALNDRQSQFLSAAQWRMREESREPAFQGNADVMTGEIRNILSDARAVEPFSLQWVEAEEGRQVRLETETLAVTWPTLFPISTRFRYAQDDGTLIDVWPPTARNSRNAPDAPKTILPDSIHLYDTARSITVAIYDVPE